MASKVGKTVGETVKGVGFGVLGAMVYNYFVTRISPYIFASQPYGYYPGMGTGGYGGGYGGMGGYGGGYGGYGGGYPRMGMFTETETDASSEGTSATTESRAKMQAQAETEVNN